MTANVEGMVREAVRAFRSGKKSEARALLEKAVEFDSYNEQAWMWLSAVVDSKEEQQTCLQNVLVINPGNERAREGLRSLGIDPDAIAVDQGESSSSEEDSFAKSSFVDDNPSPPATPPVDDKYTIESSVEWEATEPKPPAPETPSRPRPDLSPGEYDNWIAGLNLDNPEDAQAAAEAGLPAFVASSNFTDFVGDPELEEAAAEKYGADPNALRDLFGFDDEEDYDNRFTHTESFVQGPFGGEIEEDLNEPEPEPAPAVSDKITATGQPLMSPVTEHMGDDSAFFSDVSNDPLPEGGGLFMGDSAPVTSGSTADPAEMFALIPSSIKATRLPGTVEKYSPVMLVGLVVLIFLNLGALGFLMMNLAG